MIKALFVATLGLAICVTANADTLQFTGFDTGAGTHLTVDLSLNSVVYHLAAVKLDFYDSTTNSALVTVCADLTQSLDVNNPQDYNVSTAPPDNEFPGGDKAAQIVANFFASAVTWQQQAGLQLAVWDALYNNGNTFDLSGSSSPLSILSYNGTPSADIATINADASAYYAGFNMGGTVNFYQPVTPGSPTTPGGQSQFAPVPEPSSLGFLVVGLAGFLRRKRP